jgi:hypothetical protein
VGDRGLGAAAVLRDLDQVDLVGAEGRLQGGRQLVGDLRGGTGVDRGAGDAMQRGVGDAFALA